MFNWIRNMRGAIGVTLFVLSVGVLVTSHIVIWYGFVFPETDRIVNAGNKVMQENRDQSMPTFMLWTHTKELGMNMGITFALSSAGLLLSIILGLSGFLAAYFRVKPEPNPRPPENNARYVI